jgi:hypothetical protein
METVSEALNEKTGVISIDALARLVEVPPERLRPLVEQNYLCVVKACILFEETIVRRPGQRATEWLKSMFQPLKMRPVIPLKEAGRLWGLTARTALKYCRLGKDPRALGPCVWISVVLQGTEEPSPRPSEIPGILREIGDVTPTEIKDPAYLPSG